MTDLVQILEVLERLLNKWKISNENWVLAARYALRVLGYEVKVRKGHLNIFVNKEKIPWKANGELQTHPPVNTNWAVDFYQFIKNTGFDFDIKPKPPAKFKAVIERSILYSLPDKKRIYVHTPMGMLDELDNVFSMSTPEGLGKEKGIRTLLFAQDQEKVLREKGEIETADAYQDLIIKYSHFKSTGMKQRDKADIKKVDKLYGIPASKGQTKGRATIVRNISMLKKFRRGDILIIPTSSPRLTPAIQKAAAIVADEGGMLCHAAIISRELEVPCVVGVKNATKIFKNGEIVVVNAVEGSIYRVKG